MSHTLVVDLARNAIMLMLIIAGGSMNMPMLMSTEDTTTSMTMKGRNSAKPI